MKTATTADHRSISPVVASLGALAGRFIESFPAMDADGQRLALALYRLIGRGRPASLSNLANVTGFGIDRVRDILSEWPGVFYDDQGAIVGFWGIAVGPMTHRLEINGTVVYAWCAWDTLFLPELLQATVNVVSRCEQTGDTVRLQVSPHGIESVEPRSAVMSFVQAEEHDLRQNVTTSFCHFVHFFRDRDAGSQWVGAHPGTFVLPLATAFDLGRRVNAARYPDSLNPQGNPS